MIKDKIKKLAQSPVIASDEDIDNFAKIMQLSNEHTKILHQGKKLIKDYYISNNVDMDDMHIIDNALILVSGELPDGIKESNNDYNNIQESNTAKEDLHLKDGNRSQIQEQMLLNKIQNTNLTYFEKISEVVDSFADNTIDKDTVNLIALKVQLEPKDVMTIYEYLYNDNKEVFDRIIDVPIFQIPKDKGLTYLEKAVLLARGFSEGKIDGEKADDIAVQSGINLTDLSSIYDALYGNENINPSEDQILNIARKYEKDDIYVGVNIPADKRKNFRQIINQKIEGKVLVLIDLTFFGSAEKAIVVTEYGLYFRDDDNEGFVAWQELYSINLVKSKSDEYEYVLILGDKYNIDISGSNSSHDEIIAFLKGLCSLEDTIKTSPKVNELEDIQPDIDITKALHNPYVTLEQLISKTFLYSSPVYAIATHLGNYNINNVDDGAYDIVREHMEILSDKHQLEKIIIESEKNFIGLFTAGISSTRQDILNFMQTDIGNTFTYNNQVLNSLQHELKSYQNLIIPKIAELYNASQQLDQYWVQSEEGIGKGFEGIIKGGALGAMGATLFGPLGIAAAMGASYLNDNEKEKKKGDIEDTLLDNWSKLHDSFYFIKLKDYYQAYTALSNKISKQFIENYKKAEQQAKQNNKKPEFDRYITSEITSLVSGKEFISMRDELVAIEEMFA